MALLGELFRRVWYLGRRLQFDRDLDEEVRFHIETRADELERAGVTRDQAVAQATREFGSATLIREDTRSAWELPWLEDLVADLRYAVRSLGRNPAFALTAIACLALGIGANTTIFSLSSEMLFSQPSCRDPRTLFQVWIGGSSASPLPEYRFVRDAGIFAGLAGENEETEVNWQVGDSSSRLFTVRVTDNFFGLVGIPLARGRSIQPGDSDVAVVTHGFWQRRLGGDANVIGRKLVLDGHAHVVVGVLPSDHRTVTGFGFSPDLYLPLSNDQTAVTFYARLPQGMTRQAAYARLIATCKELDRIYSHGNQRWAGDVKVLSISGIDRLVGEEMMPVTAFFAMLMIVVGLVLLIACANVASLLLARASGRAHELAIRLSIGAGRGRIVRQLLTESLLLAVCGAGAGLALNLVLTSFLNGFQLPLPLPLQLRILPDWRLLAYSVVITLVCTVASGLAPAIKGTREDIGAALKHDDHQVGDSRWMLRYALVVGQLAVSIVLLCAGFIFMRNLLRSTSMSPGFDIEHTVWSSMRLVPEAYSEPDKTRAFVSAALTQLRSLPGVEAASIARKVPLNGHSTTGTKLRTDVGSLPVMVTFNDNYVGADYFRAMRIAIVQGREFSSEDNPGSPRVAILNEAMAVRLFGKMSALGHTIRFMDRSAVMIVGVAKNSKYFTIGEQGALAYYVPYAQWEKPEPDLQFVIRALNSPEPIITQINRVLGQLDSTAALETKPMNKALIFALLPSRVGAAVLGSIGLLGLTLAAIGLYGLLAYTVSRRTREIGLRMALGASPTRILGLVLRQSLTLVAVGVGAGTAMAVFAVRPLAAFLNPAVRPEDPANFLVVGAVLSCVALLATVSPAVRALRVDPVAALRND
jgi:predicted permease